jgi:hypothetical protein
MITKYAKVKSLIFDGAESEILNKSFNPDAGIDAGGAIRFNDFTNNNFEDLRKILKSDDFESIVKTGGFTSDGGFLNLYKGSDNLRLYFCKRGDVIVIFAYGEFQPTRYKLYLEGIWLSSIK